MFGWLKIPLIAYTRPTVVEASNDRVVVRIRLSRRTKNHLGSMYFGALSVGADLAAGYAAMQRIAAADQPVSFVFQAVAAEFLRRPDGAVDFVCDRLDPVHRIVDRTLRTGEREAADVPVTCVLASNPSQVVARFTMTLSVKASKGKKEKGNA